MTSPHPHHLSEVDYAAIEAALVASEKGRHFLEAYLARHRGSDMVRLLRSISRLHSAAIGAPELYLGLARDLRGLRRQLVRARLKIGGDQEGGARALAIAASLDDIEASLMVVIEAIEDRIAETATPGDEAPDHSFLCGPDPDESRQEKLYGELSLLFSSDRL